MFMTGVLCTVCGAQVDLSKCKDIQNTCFVVPISQSPTFSVNILLLFFFCSQGPVGNKLLALMGHPWEKSSYKYYLIHI